jgi:hypothetical protein
MQSCLEALLQREVAYRQRQDFYNNVRTVVGVIRDVPGQSPLSGFNLVDVSIVLEENATIPGFLGFVVNFW